MFLTFPLLQIHCLFEIMNFLMQQNSDKDSFVAYLPIVFSSLYTEKVVKNDAFNGWREYPVTDG